MDYSKISFNKTDNPEFFTTLTRRVNEYFSENQISKFANGAMYLKTVIIVLLYIIPLTWLIVGPISTLYTHFILWAIMGLGMVGIGLTIMHDANHGAYSRNPKVNEFMGGLLNLVGAYHVNWKIQHNVFHHTYTNIVGHDEDIRKTIIRFSPKHPYFFLHKFQAFYSTVLYMIYPFIWILSKDFEQYNRYKGQNLYSKYGRTDRRALTEIIVLKTLYWPVTLFLPIYFSPFSVGYTIAGYFIHHFISGIILAYATQPAHVGDDMEFFSSDDNNGSMENNWAVHQMKTTANFAENSAFLTWFFGGLNYQIEHHLFPTVCHVHYKNISKIVKQTAQEFNLPYKSHRTFYDALKSHFGHLNRMAIYTVQ